MRKHGMPVVKEGGVNVTPLIDVVMVLIVFFMLVAKIGVSTGADPKIKIPASIYGTEIKDMGNVLYLNVSPMTKDSDTPIVTAMVTNTKTGVSSVTELKLQDGSGQNQVVNTLKFYRFGKDLKKGGVNENADNDSFQVVIRGDKDMHFAALEPVLVSCAEANVKAVNFNTAKVSQAAPASDEH